MHCGTASKNRKVKSGSDFSDNEVFHLPQVPDMPIAGSANQKYKNLRDDTQPMSC